MAGAAPVPVLTLIASESRHSPHPHRRSSAKFSPLEAVFFFRSPAGFWVNVKTRCMPEQSYQVHVERRS